MNIRKLVKQLVYDEGLVPYIYQDSLGHATLGIGHLIRAQDKEFGEPIGSPVSMEVIYEYFIEDLYNSIDDAKKLYPNWRHLPSEVQEILVNMMFNLGIAKLNRFFKMNTAIARYDFKEASKEGIDSLWYSQVKHRAERLMTRMNNVV